MRPCENPLCNPSRNQHTHLCPHHGAAVDVRLIRAGDVVKLRTGGPQMTVVRRVDGHSVMECFECAWFDGPWDAKVLHRETFSAPSLVVTVKLEEGAA